MKVCDLCRQPLRDGDEGARAIGARIATGMKAGAGVGKEVEACGRCVRRGFRVLVRGVGITLAGQNPEPC